MDTTPMASNGQPARRINGMPQSAARRKQTYAPRSTFLAEMRPAWVTRRGARRTRVSAFLLEEGAALTSWLHLCKECAAQRDNERKPEKRDALRRDSRAD